MSYDIELKVVREHTLIVIRDRANAQNISAVISELLPEVWQFISDNNLSRVGHVVVVYHGEEGCTFHDEKGLPIEVGVQMSSEFACNERVEQSSTPAGSVASTLHIGPYQQLPQAHAAVRAWCEENGLQLQGLNWEIYGHHSPKIEELKTEVCYLLAAS